MYDPTFLYRLAAGIAIFFGFYLYERWKNPANARRPKEYSFLFGITMAAMLYGAAHDYVTWSISPDYFVYGKDIPAAAQRYFPEVMQLGMMASWSVGLLCAALLLMANNPDNSGRTLHYTRLLRFALIPFGMSIGIEAISGGIAVAFGEDLIHHFTGRTVYGQTALLAVWAMHLGAYAGVLIGLACTLTLVIREKRRLAPD